MRASGRPLVALVALAVGTFGFVTAETLPVGLLDPIADDVGVAPAQVGLLVTWYGLVVVVASVPLTQLTRKVPRRPLLCLLLGVYVLGTAASAMPVGYPALVVARVVTAASQAVFWSIVVPVAAGLFGPEVRGRVLAVVFGGSSLAAVVGVPLGTWLGQQFGWRSAFGALACLGALTLVAVALWLPRAGGAAAEVARGSEPDRRRFIALLGMTVLVTTGAFTFFTYLSPFLTGPALLSSGVLSVVLLVRGVAGLAGVAVGGALVDRRPRTALALPVVLQAVALLLLFAVPRAGLVTVALVAVTGFTFAAFTTPLARRVLRVAPGRVDLASSGISTAVNVGIALGALLGSALLTHSGAGATALVGGLLTVAGLASAALDRPADRAHRPRGRDRSTHGVDGRQATTGGVSGQNSSGDCGVSWAAPT